MYKVMYVYIFVSTYITTHLRLGCGELQEQGEASGCLGRHYFPGFDAGSLLGCCEPQRVSNHRHCAAAATTVDSAG